MSELEKAAQELCEALRETLDEARYWARAGRGEIEPAVERRAELAVEDFRFVQARGE